MATQPETTGAETQETTSEKEKLFTQEEVNSFVQSRVQRLRSQISKESNAEYEQKMADLSKREMQLVAKEKLLDSGLPKDLAGLITGENEEEIEAKIENNLSKIPAGEYQIKVGQANFFIEEKETNNVLYH